LYGTHLGTNAKDYRDCDFTGPTAFVLGAEKWGLSDQARDLMDEALFIPMRGMVQSLNVSVATATLLFESLAPTTSRGSRPKPWGRADSRALPTTAGRMVVPRGGGMVP